jgi:hypothetical protein
MYIVDRPSSRVICIQHHMNINRCDASKKRTKTFRPAMPPSLVTSHRLCGRNAGKGRNLSPFQSRAAPRAHLVAQRRESRHPSLAQAPRVRPKSPARRKFLDFPDCRCTRIIKAGRTADLRNGRTHFRRGRHAGTCGSKPRAIQSPLEQSRLCHAHVCRRVSVDIAQVKTSESPRDPRRRHGQSQGSLSACLTVLCAVAELKLGARCFRSLGPCECE